MTVMFLDPHPLLLLLKQRSTNHCLLLFGLGVGGLLDRDVAPGPTKDIDPGSCPVSECHVVHVTEIMVVRSFLTAVCHM